MKLLYITPIRFPTERAHGAQVAHMCHAFTQNDLDVELVVPKYKNTITDSPFAYYGIPETFSVTYLSSLPWGVGNKLGFLSNLIFFCAQAALLASKKSSDVIYSRHEAVLFGLSFFVPAKKLIWESHEARYNFIARSLLKKKVKCVVISEGIRDFYLEKGVSKEQLLVAHDGIDESFFGELESKEQARARLGISTEKPVVMYIGGLDAWKGVETFMKASELTDEYYFAIIGGTDSAINAYQAKYPKVHFLGQRPYRELKDNQQAADVLVIPNTATASLSAQYTSPLKLFAHLTCNRPLVCSNVPSLANVVNDQTVWFFTPDNSEDLGSVLREVLSDRDRVVKTERAYELSKQYTWGHRAQRIIDFVSV